MSKKLILYFIVAFWIAAIIAFFSRNTRSLREKIADHNSLKHRIYLGDFILYRYTDEVLKEKISGETAVFLPPNTVQITGHVNGFKKRDEKVQTLKASIVEILFKTRNFSELLHHGEIDYAIFRDEVEFGFQTKKGGQSTTAGTTHLLLTDYAKYFADQDIISGDRPINLIGDGQWVTCTDGFIYSLEQESIDLYGNVKGKIYPHDSIKTP